MASKRKKTSFDFSPEAILSEVNATQKLVETINDFKKSISLKSISELTTQGDLDVDIPSLVSLVFGSDVVYWTCFAANHVPKVFEKFKNMRLECIFQIVSVMCSSRRLKIDELEELLAFVDKYDMLMAGTFRVDEKLLENALVKLSEGEWNFSSFICPPVTECTECHATLSVANRPSLCHVYTLSGPKPSTKITLRCRNCNIYYGCAMYSRHGIFHYYDPTVLDSGTEIMVIEASNMNYIEKKLYQWLPPLINHCFVSFEGFSVVYNEVYSEQVQKLFHTTVKVASSGSASGSATCAEFSDEFIDNFEEQADHEEQDVDGDPSLGAACSSGATSKSVLRHKAEKAHIPGELHRKTVATAFWELELQKELEDLDLVQKWSFVKKKEQNSLDNNFTGTKEEAIEYIVQNRNTQTYTHECYEGCKSKGCDRLYVMDGNWKLAYAHCMFPVQVKIPGYEKEINYPNICPLSPQYQSAFCTKHHDIVVKKGMPTDLKTFIQYCANKKQDPDAVIKEAIVSDENAETVRSLEDDQCNAAAYQGTQSFMAENSALLDECTEVIKVNCNKDTVGKKRLQKWSRGIFMIASAGGHIDFWQPLYRSESPTQAFMITIVWLYNKFMKSKSEGKTDEELVKDIQATVLAYDNMCHLDTLRAAKKDLPLPKPFNTMWKDVRKVIDRLHLKNHVDPTCKTNYNPDKILSKSFNTMAAEQVNVWASRLKRAMVAMPYLHHMFFFHRMVKRRNSYTQFCYKIGKTPLLPKSAKKWKNLEPAAC